MQDKPYKEDYRRENDSYQRGNNAIRHELYYFRKLSF